MISKKIIQKLEEQQYRIIGSHSACKICRWTKKSIIDRGFCYKQKFYGINSHRCCQMTPSLACANRCVFCWRDMSIPPCKTFEEFTGRSKNENKDIDSPEKIVEGCIAAQKKLLIGLKGFEKTNMKKFNEAVDPKHFAISLIGEPLLYPKLKELIEYLHSKGKSTFVVTSGQFPGEILKIRPTQLYVSVDAPNKESFLKIENSVNKDAWERFIETLKNLKIARNKNKVRTCLRITLIKGLNMTDVEGYAKIIRISEPLFVEAKAFMYVGSSRDRLKPENMPDHEEVVEFSREITEHSGYKIIDQERKSRVVLLMKEDFDGRMMKFD